jgi:predicted GIY-YIG superfamily endonuclease
MLDWFDDNIDNLDITKNYIYVIRLVEERYYIGRTGNILRRIEEHFTNNGAIYTKAYSPVKVIEIIEEETSSDERNKTLEYMDKFGWEKVRGAGWCGLTLLKPPNKKILKMNNLREREVVFNENDERIKYLYFEEKKNIIEIGGLLNRTPGSIAYRLCKLGLIERKQKALGYIEYINSDVYREICDSSNERKDAISELKKIMKGLKSDINEIKKMLDYYFSHDNRS